MLRDWTDSLKLDGISADAERLLIRLIMKADDYGRFHAEPRLLKAQCFPLIDNLRPNDLTRWLDELSTRQLILRYEADGRSTLAIVNYGQRLKKSVAKFPPFPGESGDWLPTSELFQSVPGTSRNFPEDDGSSRNFRLEEKGSEGEVETEEKGMEGKEPAPLCSLAQAIAYGPSVRLTPEEATQWWNTRNASGWLRGTQGGHPVKIGSWQSDMAASVSWAKEATSKAKTQEAANKSNLKSWEKKV